MEPALFHGGDVDFLPMEPGEHYWFFWRERDLRELAQAAVAGNVEVKFMFHPPDGGPDRYGVVMAHPDRLPFFHRVLEVLGPDHPAREITLLKSVQLGGTLLAQIFVAASIDLDPGGILYCQATEANAIRLARTKWRLQIRTTPRLQQIFEPRQSKEGGNSTLYQERRDGRGWLQFTGANSAAALSMVSVKRLVKDDLSKWEHNEAGDPEYQADSRTKAFREAKIFAVGLVYWKPTVAPPGAFSAARRSTITCRVRIAGSASRSTRKTSLPTSTLTIPSGLISAAPNVAA